MHLFKRFLPRVVLFSRNLQDAALHPFQGLSSSLFTNDMFVSHLAVYLSQSATNRTTDGRERI